MEDIGASGTYKTVKTSKYYTNGLLLHTFCNQEEEEEEMHSKVQAMQVEAMQHLMGSKDQLPRTDQQPATAKLGDEEEYEEDATLFKSTKGRGELEDWYKAMDTDLMGVKPPTHKGQGMAHT